ncbi:MAG: high frequency lysogenization protein HflD [Pseudomonadota bacterium]
MTPRRQKTLALAGIFQAASLADSLAWRGHCDPVALEASLRSILVLDTDDPEAIFGSGAQPLRIGLTALEKTLFQPLRDPHPRQADLIRYALALMHLERKLARSVRLQHDLRQRLLTATGQRAHFTSAHDPALVRKLGGIYIDTLGSLDFRIKVKGDRRQLSTGPVPEQVRAVLLAGVRAAWLWHRLGGRRWHLAFTRGRVLTEIRAIIKDAHPR